MDRRRFLHAVSSAATLSATGFAARSVFAQSRTVNRVAVIGAGIIGSAIAYYLAKRGCEVRIVEKGLPANQASGNTFAWINAAYANKPSSYQALRQASLAEYHRLAEDVSFPARWSGSLEWFEDPTQQAQLIRDVQAFQATPGAATTIIDAARAREIEPNLEIADGLQVAHATNDGAVDAAATTQALFDKAISYGALPIMPAEVTSIRERQRDVRVITDVNRFEADLVVVAAGVGTAAIARSVGERVDTASRSTPGIIVTTDPIDMTISSVLYPPRVHIHQQLDGSVVIGEKAGYPVTEVHSRSLAGRPNEFPDNATGTRHALRILSMARDLVPELSAVRGAHVGIGWRPMPTDGLPLIGHGRNAPNIYFATMHSGVTLAPIVGRLAAEEILDGIRVDALDDFRPERIQASA